MKFSEIKMRKMRGHKSSSGNKWKTERPSFCPRVLCFKFDSIFAAKECCKSAHVALQLLFSFDRICYVDARAADVPVTPESHRRHCIGFFLS